MRIEKGQERVGGERVVHNSIEKGQERVGEERVVQNSIGNGQERGQSQGREARAREDLSKKSIYSVQRS